jgi:eukaryotic-like serine/threonine-protein kinase
MTEIYRFGQFELRPDRLQLCRGDVPIKVEPRPLQVLAELLRNAGELVTKNELMDSVWAGRIVSESVIARCINKLRVALDDDAQTLLLSVHGYGYRFSGRVTVQEDEAEGTAMPAGIERPRPGATPPMRPNWRLSQPLDEPGAIWLAQHEKTGEQRVFKYGFEPHQVPALRREVAINRLLLHGLGERSDIARLLDYNLTQPPFFIELEYCPRGNLADWCASLGGVGRVPLEVRIGLMAQAAETLAAAHAIGVLHMDIKPSNLLVWQGADGKPRLRWSDFGSGRLLQPGRLSELGITQFGTTRTVTDAKRSLRGTLNYIAPELLKGEPPTIKSDIYGLGVMLYQIVAGDLGKPVAAGWEQNVEDELLRADIAATANDNAALRLSSADELAVRLRTLGQRRETLAAERQRERDSAQLRQKLERARARRPWLAAAALALGAGIGFSLWNYRQAVLARDEARAQASIADGVINFLDRDILSEGSPFSVSTDGTARVTVREAVDRAADKLGGRFPAQPAVEASIRATIGQVYVEDGDYPAAERQIRTAVKLGRASLVGVDERTIQAEYSLAFALSVEQKFAEARQLLDEANDELVRRGSVTPYTAGRRDVINGNYYFALQDFRSAAPFFDQALAESLQRDPTDVSQISIRQTSLAWCYAAMGRFDAARPLYEAALKAVKQAEKSGGTLTGTIEERYGIGLFLAGHDADAKAMLQSGYADLKAAIGDDGLTAEALTYLGWLQLRQGHAAEATVTLREAYREELASAGADHRMTLRARACLDLAEFASGQQAASLNDLPDAVAAYERALGANAPEAELFRFMLLDESLALGRVPANIAEQVQHLAADRIAEAAPWEDWSARLAGLKSKFAHVSAAPTGK